MKISEVTLKNSIKGSLLVGASLFLYAIKVTMLMGGKNAYISAFSLFAPLLGLYSGFLPLSIFIICRAFLNYLFFGASQIIFLLHIPTLLASLYKACSSLTIRLLIPSICIIIFCSHSVGAQAWWYSLYWLIPIIIAFFPHHHIFLQMLGTTFTAHAVGSVLWLYMHSSAAPALFMQLMPIVPFERCSYALCMTAFYYNVSLVVSLWHSYVEHKKQPHFAQKISLS